MEKLIACCSGFDIRYEFEVDGEVVGECSVHQSDCYIHSLEIEEMYRNRGYARMMLRAVMSLYPGQRMWLRAWASNTPAIKAYDAVGFTIYERGPYSKYQPEEVVSMEITAPSKQIAFKKKYGLMLIEEDYDVMFDSEEERNEVALAWYEELAPALWARSFNWYDEYEEIRDFDLRWEAFSAHNDALNAIYCYEEIVMEEI